MATASTVYPLPLLPSVPRTAALEAVAGIAIRRNSTSEAIQVPLEQQLIFFALAPDEILGLRGYRPGRRQRATRRHRRDAVADRLAQRGIARCIERTAGGSPQGSATGKRQRRHR